MPIKSLTRYEITAPFKGIVIEKHISLGEAVENDTDSFIIADLNFLISTYGRTPQN